MLSVIGCDVCGEVVLEVTVSEAGEFRCIGCEVFKILELDEEPLAVAA